MKESTDKSDILSETAVFDFVAGKQSDEQQRKFEELMKQNPQLQHQVEVERELRKALSDGQQDKPVSMDNFDDLLAQIDKLEEPSKSATSSDNVTELKRPNTNNTQQDDSNVVKLPARSAALFSMAASVAVLGIVFAAFMATNYLGGDQGIDQDPNFELLSSDTQVNFLELSAEGRVAKLVLTQPLSENGLNDLLSSYQLQQFEQSGASDNNLFVYSKGAIDEQQLALLQADKRIQEIAVFSAGPAEE